MGNQWKNIGMLVSFEGIDGCGKSTIIKEVEKKIKKHFENKVVCTKEPYDNEFRKMIFNKKISNIRSEILLFTMDRVEHLKNVIYPALNQHKIVLTDRYMDSSIVYQGYVRMNDWREPYDINKWAKVKIPDLTFVLDVHPYVAEKRMEKDNKRVLNRFDKETNLIKMKTRKGFLFLAEKFPKRIIVINANKNNVDVIADEIYTKIMEKYKEMQNELNKMNKEKK